MLSTFWSSWVIVLTVIFLVLMVYVIWYYWRKNHEADEDKELHSFDGIGENDAKLPLVLLYSYLIAFIASAVFFVLYPGMGNWQGLMNWHSTDELQQQDTKIIDKKLEALNADAMTLTQLAEEQEVVDYGNRLFITHCAACHGDDAQGQKHFPNLIDKEWIYDSSDSGIIQSITHGRNGVMVGWKDVLTEQQVEDVSTYVASLQSNRAVPAAKVQLEQGKQIFEYNCSVCHGDNGSGNPQIGAYNLSDSTWVHGGSINEIKTTVREGLDSVMPAFDKQLSNAQITALGAFITHARIAKQQSIASLDQDLVKRGEYLAYAGDCVACHTAEDGELFGGGLPFPTPFGTLYSTNISTHVERGIGSYTYQEFHDAVRLGVAKHGNLYPAMPYTSYQYITEEDTKALWTYMQSLTPVNTMNQDNTMMFPSNIRLGMWAWNLAFFDESALTFDEKQSDRWKRGKYLTLGFGHCSECHTPRNIAQALEADKPFQGNIIDHWNAPDITANELHEHGWTMGDIADFLQTGHSAKGTAFAGMADVVKNSTRYMTREDLEAIGDYLLTGDENNRLDPNTKPLEPTGFTAADMKTKEFQIFADTCGACHGADGKGRKDIAPALLGNGIISHSEPYNTVAVVLRGLSPDYLEPNRDYMPMSSFNNIAGDGEMADMISFIRNKLGDRHDAVTRDMVKDIRIDLEKSGVTGGFHDAK
ncbi:cytochrome-c oxidase, cbb3-type subunit III [Vibrio rumoiensis]|uniref:Cytochrome c oxidase subunit III n=1 Tax=Vibrio rumoiensis 1S-45 TaxID=1188252 RepID=A0A1E5DYR0_9VIBR|nr:cytochrome-c oxidase, cbb3-type subunit III [Vibrio rumoiensis]OEF22866.1 cytochrome-c oxidase, cbb3-type subunit III [Vibrio rumoiensis 1S-45]